MSDSFLIIRNMITLPITTIRAVERRLNAENRKRKIRSTSRAWRSHDRTKRRLDTLYHVPSAIDYYSCRTRRRPSPFDSGQKTRRVQPRGLRPSTAGSESSCPARIRFISYVYTRIFVRNNIVLLIFIRRPSEKRRTHNTRLLHGLGDGA